jgi:chloramphenicol 3-O-phosphotransferase
VRAVTPEGDTPLCLTASTPLASRAAASGGPGGGMDRGSLIILNGGSSAGKTSLGRVLQDAMLPETWLSIA